MVPTKNRVPLSALHNSSRSFGLTLSTAFSSPPDLYHTVLRILEASDKILNYRGKVVCPYIEKACEIVIQQTVDSLV